MVAILGCLRRPNAWLSLPPKCLVVFAAQRIEGLVGVVLSLSLSLSLVASLGCPTNYSHATLPPRLHCAAVTRWPPGGSRDPSPNDYVVVVGMAVAPAVGSCRGGAAARQSPRADPPDVASPGTAGGCRGPPRHALALIGGTHVCRAHGDPAAAQRHGGRLCQGRMSLLPPPHPPTAKRYLPHVAGPSHSSLRFSLPLCVAPPLATSSPPTHTHHHPSPTHHPPTTITTTTHSFIHSLTHSNTWRALAITTALSPLHFPLDLATQACIHDLFLENALAFPDRVAVVFLGQR